MQMYSCHMLLCLPPRLLAGRGRLHNRMLSWGHATDFRSNCLTMQNLAFPLPNFNAWLVRDHSDGWCRGIGVCHPRDGRSLSSTFNQMSGGDFPPLSVFWLPHFAFTAHCQCSYAGLRHCEYFNNFYTSRLRLHTPFILFLECWCDWGTLAHKFYPSITLKWLYSLGHWEVRTTPSNTQPTSRPYNAFFLWQWRWHFLFRVVGNFLPTTTHRMLLFYLLKQVSFENK